MNLSNPSTKAGETPTANEVAAAHEMNKLVRADVRVDVFNQACRALAKKHGVDLLRVIPLARGLAGAQPAWFS